MSRPLLPESPTGRHYRLEKRLIVRNRSCPQPCNEGSRVSDGAVGAVREPSLSKLRSIGRAVTSGSAACCYENSSPPRLRRGWWGTGQIEQVNHPLSPSLSRRGISRNIFIFRGEPKAHERLRGKAAPFRGACTSSAQAGRLYASGEPVPHVFRQEGQLRSRTRGSDCCPC